MTAKLLSDLLLISINVIKIHRLIDEGSLVSVHPKIFFSGWALVSSRISHSTYKEDCARSVIPDKVEKGVIRTKHGKVRY